MKKIYLLSALLIVVACNDREASESLYVGNQHNDINSLISNEGYEQQIPRTAEPPAPESYELDKGSKIIKNGNLDFEVSDLYQSKKEVDMFISKYDAYYENEEYNSYGNRISYALSIRIPNVRFDSMVDDLESGIGNLTSKNIYVRDVTEEYVDLNIRLENKLSYLNQYKEILKKAKSIKEILEVQDKIRRIEEEIESKKGRLKYLDDKVKFSTLNLTLSQLVPVKVTNQPSFGRRIANAFNNGIEGFLNFIVVMVNLWPFLLLMTLLIIFRKRIFKSFTKKID